MKPVQFIDGSGHKTGLSAIIVPGGLLFRSPGSLLLVPCTIITAKNFLKDATDYYDQNVKPAPY